MYGRGRRPLEVWADRAAGSDQSSECQHDAGTNVGTDGPPSRDIRLVTARTHAAVREKDLIFGNRKFALAEFFVDIVVYFIVSWLGCFLYNLVRGKTYLGKRGDPFAIVPGLEAKAKS